MQVLKEEINQTILDSAQAMFIEQGYEATTLNAISKEAGISKSNLYNYFENKEALFEALVAPAVRDVQSASGFFATTIFSMNDIDSLTNALVEKIPILYTHKASLLLLLDCSKGTKFEFMVDSVINELAIKLHENVLTAANYSLISRVISKNLVLAIIQILRDCNSEVEFRENLAFLVQYHIDGIHSLVD